MNSPSATFEGNAVESGLSSMTIYPQNPCPFPTLDGTTVIYVTVRGGKYGSAVNDLHSIQSSDDVDIRKGSLPERFLLKNSTYFTRIGQGFHPCDALSPTVAEVATRVALIPLGHRRTGDKTPEAP